MRHFRTTALAALICSVATIGAANTYTVTSTADSGAGTLRQAILDANANPGADTIAFNITGSGVHTIALTAALPYITDAVTIDGYTQAGSSPNTHAVGEGLDTVLKIEIDGTGATQNGLWVQAPDVTIRGLAINRFPAYQIEGAGYPYNTANLVVEGCFVGTTPDGLHASGTGPGVDAEHLNFRIGGLIPAQRNLIAKEVHLTGQGVAQGNLIGTDATGLRAAAPGTPSGRGVYLYGGNAITFGGTDPNAANVVAGFDEGLRLESAASTVQGNFFGVDAGQIGVIPSGATGIMVISGGVIGGAGPGEGNVIGGFETGVQIGHPVTFQGNAVGTDFSGTRNLGNRINGVYVTSGILSIGGIAPGEANLIAFNGWAGILLYSYSSRVTMRGNRIFENGLGGTAGGGVQGIGIDLGFATGPDGPTANDPGDGDAGSGYANDWQNFPLIASATPEGGGTRVIGTLNSIASAVFDLDFYGNPACRTRPRALLQGETYLGTTQVTTDAAGNASFNVLLSTPIDAGAPVTATATDAAGNTSEFWNPILFRDSPGVGGPGDSNTQDLFGQLFEPGATITVGGTPIAGVVETSTTRRKFVGPSLTPGTVYDIVLTNPSGLSGTLHNGYVSRFLDVGAFTLFDRLISQLVANGVTAGCGGGNYCPNSNVTRKQMAVFVLKAKHGVCYVPPPCAGVFPDVPCSSNFAPWIEEFAAEGITGGCGNGDYCPEANVRRDQMAVFLLKGKYGSSFTPPPCAGVFGDVACPSTFANWIEQLAAEGVTGGCGNGNYCPLDNNTRGQMAAFLVKAMNLP